MKILRPETRALIVVPPFYTLTLPSLAAHLLQGCAQAAGFGVSVLYANLALAAAIGQEHYHVISAAHTNGLPGERLFAASAYGVPPLGYEPEKMVDMGAMTAASTQNPKLAWSLELLPPGLDLAELKRLEELIRAWVDDTAQAIASQGYRIVGCTTSFEQTAASVALLARVKCLSPQVVTIIGGANCEGQMAAGVASLSLAIDYVFSGESEATFPEFLGQITTGQLPADRIIYGQPCQNLDAIPTPDFTEFYQQLAHYLPDLAAQPAALKLPYESSRGCWWGQKHHCAFCGLNGQSLIFRQKSSERVIGELKQLLDRHCSRRVYMTDNIMPFSYFNTLLPRLAAELPGLRLFYEQKANLSLAQVTTLKQAGVETIIPGIEGFSSPLLQRLNKGLLARQNMALLRYARAVKLHLEWYLLWGFPGDQPADYEQTLALLPLLRHLEPPVSLNLVHLTRFSPYVEEPDEYGLRHLRPWDCYAKILPDSVDPAQVAYYFTAEYESAAHQHPELILGLRREVELWQVAWNFKIPLAGQFLSCRPRLEVIRHAVDQFELRDTRGLPDTEVSYALNRQQAAVALVGGPLHRANGIEWALARKVGVELDGWYVPLATAQPELLQEFEQVVD
ncbi:MAG: RiPP maturation radical SAM C-methyltransferase [Anaerolineae bacterium]|nr:RiPP maturation radical SAM C-methyltransferase [Anaerolineae bacterium]